MSGTIRHDHTWAWNGIKYVEIYIYKNYAAVVWYCIIFSGHRHKSGV